LLEGILVATIRCTSCGLVNPDTASICRRCNEVLILDPDSGWETETEQPPVHSIERSAYDRPIFPPPARDFGQESAARLARITGGALAGIGLLTAMGGLVLGLRQFVFAGIATIASGWLVAAGRMLGIYFYTLSWFLTIVWVIGATRGRLDANTAVLTQMVVPSLVLVLLWWKLPAYLKLDAVPRSSTPFGSRKTLQPGPSPAVGAVAVALGLGLIGATVWGALGQKSNQGGKPASYWIGELSNPNAAIRRTAAVSLGEIDSPDAIPYLGKAMSDEDAGVRKSAVDALSNKDGELAVRQLKLGLWSDFKDVREWSLTALQNRDLYIQAESRIESERANKVQPPRR